MLKDNSRPSILEANFFYLFIGIILLTLGSYVQNQSIYLGLLITEFVIILIPTLFYLKMRQYSLKRVLRLNKISIKQAVLIPIIVIFSYPIGVFLNYIMLIILNYFGKVSANAVPIPESGQEMIIGLIVIALSAGICEEIMFRGFVMKAYERQGVAKSIVYSAILFGLFHFNVQNLLGPIYLGILFGYIVYKTDSIFSSIIAHATNNAFALILGMLVSKINIDPEVAVDVAAQGVISDTLTMIIGAIGIGFIAIISGVIVFFLLKLLPETKNTRFNNFDSGFNEEIDSQSEAIVTKVEKVISFIPILIVLFIFILTTYMLFVR